MCSIVFANKTVFSVLNFRFVYALTLVHVLTTLLGMHLFAAMGLYERKRLPIKPLLSLAAAFVGYIVFWNVSLKVSPLSVPKQAAVPGSATLNRELKTRVIWGLLTCTDPLSQSIK